MALNCFFLFLVMMLPLAEKARYPFICKPHPQLLEGLSEAALVGPLTLKPLLWMWGSYFMGHADEKIQNLVPF
jgi:hypothetical protein